MRRKMIAGNWKMNKTVEEAVKLAEGIKCYLAARTTDVDVVLCPPFTAIQAVAHTLSETRIHVGAQNMGAEDGGAYTGEIAHGMLKELLARYVILGHSERRQYFRESDQLINQKVLKALDKQIRPILCVGEKLEDRRAGHTAQVVGMQVREGLKGISAAASTELVIAYEPVWAIGTGKTATPEQAQEVHVLIRDWVKESVGGGAAETMRILYGGSMHPDNAEELLVQADVDGGLIGTAALDAASFAAIVNTADEVVRKKVG